MTKTEIAKIYLKLLDKGDINGVLNLFTEHAKVESPIYGIKSAKDFYTQLNQDTNNSQLKLKGVFHDLESGQVAIYFNYIWTMKNGKIAEFDVVDIIEFDDSNKITFLKIIYDTVQSRVYLKA